MTRTCFAANRRNDARMFWIIRRALRVGLTALLVAGASARTLAEQDARQPRESGPFFVGGAFLLSSAHGATQDPPGYGYLRPYFHGSPHWPAPGAMLAGGVFVGEDWSVAGEFAFRRSASATVSEESRTHFEFSQVSVSTDGGGCITVVICHAWRSPIRSSPRKVKSQCRPKSGGSSVSVRVRSSSGTMTVKRSSSVV